MAKNCHSHNTRRAAKNYLQIPSFNTKFGMRTFVYQASKVWNNLPNELLDIQSLLKFKTSVNDFFNKTAQIENLVDSVYNLGNP